MEATSHSSLRKRSALTVAAVFVLAATAFRTAHAEPPREPAARPAVETVTGESESSTTSVTPSPATQDDSYAPAQDWDRPRVLGLIGALLLVALLTAFYMYRDREE